MMIVIRYNRRNVPQADRGYNLINCDLIGSNVVALLEGNEANALEDLDYKVANKNYAIGASGRGLAYPGAQGRENGVKEVMKRQNIELP